jgi:hypothetical protein
MKIRSPLASIALALPAFFTLNSQFSAAHAQGTAFTYQGQLSTNGAPANGLYDFRFRLDNDVAGDVILGTVFTNAIPVTNGLFTTTIDFGAGILTGSNYWLEVDVRTNNTVNYTGLTPLQALTPTPYAVFANTASNVSGTVSAAQLNGFIANGNLPANPVFSGTVTAGSLSGNGANLTSLNANNLSSGTVPLAQLSGITSNQLDAATWQLATNLNGGNAALASNVVSGISITNAFITNSVFAGDGSGLTNLNAAQLTGGVIPLAQLPAAVVTNNNGTSVNLTGTFTGNGSNLTSLNASQLASIGNTNGGVVNFFIGSAGNSTTSGSGNLAFAGNSLEFDVAGSQNAAFGNGALEFNTAGSANAAFGSQALGANTTGSDNTAMGVHALEISTNGSDNTAIGSQTLQATTTSFDNAAFGSGALSRTTTGSDNTAIGSDALLNNKTGSNNIAIGFNAGSDYTANESSNIDIGNQGVQFENNTIRIGTQGIQTNTFIAGVFGTTAASGVEVFVNGNGQLGTLTSSARFKQNIQSMSDASDVLLSLHPVTFKYKPELDPKGIPQFGLVAEEVDKVDPDLVARDDKGGIYTVRYEAVNAMLLNEFLKQHQKVEEQNQKIATLEEKAAKMDALEKRLNELEAAMKSLEKR